MSGERLHDHWSSGSYAVDRHKFFNQFIMKFDGSNRKAMNRNWSNQKANPALKTKAGNK